MVLYERYRSVLNTLVNSRIAATSLEHYTHTSHITACSSLDPYLSHGRTLRPAINKKILPDVEGDHWGRTITLIDIMVSYAWRWPCGWKYCPKRSRMQYSNGFETTQLKIPWKYWPANIPKHLSVQKYAVLWNNTMYKDILIMLYNCVSHLEQTSNSNRVVRRSCRCIRCTLKSLLWCPRSGAYVV